ncbi:uncharacterized protein LOC132934036 [Metopolophium dirhodum]|uniref:uncharacterized protein LOC132934036 n=1 Tax=Metopolophium dirhodum TaxID=44670 RepID=UPI002990500B|nr:uncharacterized protein LOC132934036 [Metopolophium dirhodum]
MAAADDQVTYALPSLVDLAYYACDRDQRKRYDELPVPAVDLQECCDSILKIIKFNSFAHRFQPNGHRRSMFAKVHPDYRLINNILEVAAFHGHINCMKLGHAIGVPWYTSSMWQKSACDEAADTGNMECLVYAHVNGSPWSTWTCNFAAGGGHLDCLKYCRENGCPWDDYTFTCEMAACNGNLECLKYARTNGCPWTERTCIVAAYYGHLECLRYAFENGCRWDIDGYLSTFHGMKDPSCVMYAIELKYRLPPTIATTSSPGDP